MPSPRNVITGIADEGPRAVNLSARAMVGLAITTSPTRWRECHKLESAVVVSQRLDRARNGEMILYLAGPQLRLDLPEPVAPQLRTLPMAVAP